jgi:hypothetical protein
MRVEIMSDIYQTFNYGYDLSVPEEATPTEPPRLETLPSSATVDTQYLPPVGHQTVPNCFVWATTYGLATFWAAQKGGYSPNSASRWASPDYTYVQVEHSQGLVNICNPGKMAPVLEFLINNDGTAAVSAAPDQPSNTPTAQACANDWTNYGPGTATIPPDASFAITEYKCITVSDDKGLDAIRSVIASGMPLAYGTYLYTDFPTYKGESIPTPYVGNQIWLTNAAGDKVGHCMVIIGYNDAYNNTDGAFLIQNSFGPAWGTTQSGAWQANSNGFVWMAYSTFRAMAEGLAFYIPTAS